ncbi:hypothetical protein K438DRAFT_1758229 [Mycena galopus ATCC 62051]|nr:hypothetical protein K438DRAFT_1758229 [Mycena galopus ATCC 62051]
MDSLKTQELKGDTLQVFIQVESRINSNLCIPQFLRYSYSHIRLTECGYSGNCATHRIYLVCTLAVEIRISSTNVALLLNQTISIERSVLSSTSIGHVYIYGETHGYSQHRKARCVSAVRLPSLKMDERRRGYMIWRWAFWWRLEAHTLCTCLPISAANSLPHRELADFGILDTDKEHCRCFGTEHLPRHQMDERRRGYMMTSSGTQALDFLAIQSHTSGSSAAARSALQSRTAPSLGHRIARTASANTGGGRNRHNRLSPSRREAREREESSKCRKECWRALPVEELDDLKLQPSPIQADFYLDIIILSVNIGGLRGRLGPSAPWPPLFYGLIAASFVMVIRHRHRCGGVMNVGEDGEGEDGCVANVVKCNARRRSARSRAILSGVEKGTAKSFHA